MESLVGGYIETLSVGLKGVCVLFPNIIICSFSCNFRFKFLYFVL